MDSKQIELTSPEMGALWNTYMHDSATICFVKHFLVQLKDQEIRLLAEEAFQQLQTRVDNVRKIFNEENIPVPHGFTDDDVDLTAPPLFSDLYALSFVYRMCVVCTPQYATTLSFIARL